MKRFAMESHFAGENAHVHELQNSSILYPSLPALAGLAPKSCRTLHFKKLILTTVNGGNRSSRMLITFSRGVCWRRYAHYQPKPES